MEPVENERLLRSTTKNPFVLGEYPLSLFDSLLFRWFIPILAKGSSTVQGLEEKDLWNLVGLPASCKANVVFEAFQTHWQNQILEKNRFLHDLDTATHASSRRYHSLSGGVPSVVYCLARAFGGEFIRAGTLKLIHDLSMFVGPLVLHEFITFTRDTNAQWTRGLMLTLIVAFSQIVMSLCLRHYFFRCYMSGLRMRSAIVMAVYQKALVISSAERNRMSSGEIGNLMSIDAQRIQDLTTYLHALWYSFLQIGLSIYFLWQQLGPSCLGGTAVILVTMPIGRSVAAWMCGLQQNLMIARDSRVEKLSEVFSNMKFIKCQAWEKSVREAILSLRETELHCLFKYVIANTVSVLMWTSIPLLVSIVTFSVYILTGNELEVSTALTAIALFEILRFPIFMFGEVVNDLVEAGISLSRVRNFLLSDEFTAASESKELGVLLQSASFSYEHNRTKLDITDDGDVLLRQKLSDARWEISQLRCQLNKSEIMLSNRKKDSWGHIEDGSDSSFNHDGATDNYFALQQISLSCKCGELIAIVGKVGAGKTSLTHAILGELRLISGLVQTHGKISYLAQTPFIMNDTIKNNILFYRDDTVDENRYQQAISICALDHDIALLPNGDETEIGERGITLSGGQKARVALARLFYSDSDIYLLDDPLSAIDPVVGKFIFEECIVKLASKAAVILVTNAIQYLSNPAVSRIVVLQEGRMIESGSYNELSTNAASLFSSFIRVVEDVQYKYVANSGSNRNPKNIVKKRHATIKNEDKKELFRNSEEMEKGKIGLDVYYGWIKAAGGGPFIVVLILGYTMVECLKNLAKLILTFWSYSSDSERNVTYLSVYVALNFLTVLAMLGRVLFIYKGGMKASRNLFVDTLDIVLQAPMSFFETIPLGRLMNRFSKDMHTIDEVLTSTVRSYLGTIFEVLGIVTVISVVTPIFIVGLIPIVILYIRQQSYFTRTYRALKRLDSISRSPQFSLLHETLDGVVTVRAFEVQNTFLRRMQTLLDTQQTAYFLTCTAQCWLAVRLELAGLMIIVVACLSLVAQHRLKAGDEKFVGLSGLSISCALAVTQALNWSVRMGADLEAQMVAVERVQEYRDVPTEAAQVLLSDNKVDTMWPSNGEIQFTNCCLRYRSNTPLVLNGLSFKIPPKSKVGCVGRTGCGKSSIISALLRLVELESGNVLIDGLDIKHIGLHLLRSNIAVIPQDPVLFAGSIRSNLDAFKKHSDQKLIKALKQVGLMTEMPRVSDPVKKLDDIVLEGGKNFSVGQRQLIVFSRAILSGAKIILIDEATASVDASTDAMIQQIVRAEFKESTCFTIAHRINTIMDSDLILVINEGHVEEFDTPAELMKKGGIFSNLVQALDEDSVRKIY